MFGPHDIPPRSQEPATIAQVANRAAPIVGAIILSFGALESNMRSLIIGVRMQKASRAGKWPPNLKLSHKGRERANEWIREVLTASGRQVEGDEFRERFTIVKHVRDNLAHNIEAMWIDEADRLRILTIYENKDYEKQQARWGQTATHPPAGPPPSPIGHAAYSDDDLVAHYDEIRSLLLFVDEANRAPELPIPLARQVSEQDRAYRTQGDHRANPS